MLIYATAVSINKAMKIIRKLLKKFLYNISEKIAVKTGPGIKPPNKPNKNAEKIIFAIIDIYVFY